jgi:hypothetical protein
MTLSRRLRCLAVRPPFETALDGALDGGDEIRVHPQQLLARPSADDLVAGLAANRKLGRAPDCKAGWHATLPAFAL